MHWHNRFHHLSHLGMMRLSKAGILPASFSKMKTVPKCASCAFSKTQKRPWRTKGSPGGSIRKDSETNPGDGVSTDQLVVSAQEGLIPQVTGTLTSARITGATVFVDHVMKFLYVHLMRSLSTEETLEIKAAANEFLQHTVTKLDHTGLTMGDLLIKIFSQTLKNAIRASLFAASEHTFKMQL